MAVYAALGLKLASNSNGFEPARQESCEMPCQSSGSRIGTHIYTRYTSWERRKREGTKNRGMGTYGIAHAPDGEADALGLVEAGLGDGDVVVGRGVDDVDLSEGDLGDAGGGEGLDGGAGLAREAGREVGLRADAVDGDAGRDPLLDVGDHAGGHLRVVGLVEVVVVDVQLRIRVRLARRLERDAHEVLAKHLREYGAAEGSVLVEDLVYDILEF